MAWIRTIAEDEAAGRLGELYEEYSTPDGSVDHILKIHGLNPESLKGHFDLYRTLMYGRSPLTRTQREMIAVVVSAANRCRY